MKNQTPWKIITTSSISLNFQVAQPCMNIYKDIFRSDSVGLEMTAKSGIFIQSAEPLSCSNTLVCSM